MDARETRLTACQTCRGTKFVSALAKPSNERVWQCVNCGAIVVTAREMTAQAEWSESLTRVDRIFLKMLRIRPE